MRDDYIIQRCTPAIEDYLRLRKAAGLSPFSREAAERGLMGTLFAVVAAHRGEAIGMGRLVGDGGCFFQIVDIAVDPRHQGKGLGKQIMTALMDHVHANLPETAHVSLLADVPANKLYRQFGFRETAPASLGMAMRVV